MPTSIDQNVKSDMFFHSVASEAMWMGELSFRDDAKAVGDKCNTPAAAASADSATQVLPAKALRQQQIAQAFDATADPDLPSSSASAEEPADVLEHGPSVQKPQSPPKQTDTVAEQQKFSETPVEGAGSLPEHPTSGAKVMTEVSCIHKLERSCLLQHVHVVAELSLVSYQPAFLISSNCWTL